MKIDSIKITQKTNLGNWESLEFTADAALGESDNINEATVRLFNYIDWHVKRPLRDPQAANHRLVLADENSTPEKKAVAQKWLDKYEERRAEMEKI